MFPVWTFVLLFRMNCTTENNIPTVYPKKYAHGFVVLCFVVVMQSFIMNSHEVFIHIHQGCFAGTGAIVRLPQCQWSKPDGDGKISQCITTTKHSKAKTVCIFLGIYCICKYRRHHPWSYKITLYSVAAQFHGDVIKWKHFPRYCPFVKESTGHWCQIFLMIQNITTDDISGHKSVDMYAIIPVFSSQWVSDCIQRSSWDITIRISRVIIAYIFESPSSLK